MCTATGTHNTIREIASNRKRYPTVKMAQRDDSDGKAAQSPTVKLPENGSLGKLEV